MKKLALATAFLFASSMFVMAQSTASPSSTDQQQPSATSPSTASPSSTSPADQSASPSSTQSPSDQSSSQSSMGSSSEQSIQGCLSQGANGFTLADASGTTYNLTGDTSKLSAHVGEEVQVKGSASSSSSAASSTSPSGSSASSTSPSSASGQNFDVKSVKRISKSCSTSGSSANPSSH